LTSSIKWIATGLLVFWGIALTVEMWHAWHFPEQYPFNAEAVAGVWAYKSQQNYLVAAAIHILLTPIAIAAVLIQRMPRWLRWLCLGMYFVVPYITNG